VDWLLQNGDALSSAIGIAVLYTQHGSMDEVRILNTIIAFGNGLFACHIIAACSFNGDSKDTSPHALRIIQDVTCLFTLPWSHLDSNCACDVLSHVITALQHGRVCSVRVLPKHCPRGAN
jgi:hypothetical protein